MFDLSVFHPLPHSEGKRPQSDPDQAAVQVLEDYRWHRLRPILRQGGEDLLQDDVLQRGCLQGHRHHGYHE